MNAKVLLQTLVLLVGAGVQAQPTGAVHANPLSVEGLGTRAAGSPLSWGSIASATNHWAVMLRQQQGWSAVAGAPLEKVRALAAGGLPLAQLELGFCYYTGDGLERDYAQGARWLLKAQQFPLAQFLLGAASLRGLGVQQDFAAGVDWLGKAADAGIADAQFQLGLCYLTGGPGVNKAPARGAKWLEHAAQQGHLRAQQCLAECYAGGLGVDHDDSKAAQWYRRAADQGYPVAQDFLAVCYAAGNGVNRSDAEAARWFAAAAKQGYALAQANLARCYAHGLGVATNRETALAWWRQAARQGFPGARFHLGLGYLSGKGVPKDAVQAVAEFRQDARRGHVGALLYLGLCYWKGEGVTQDQSEARKWWRQAALQGIRPQSYLPGDGSAGDAPEIEHWWQTVARQGDAELKSCVAEFYRYGHGVPQNDAQAVRWYRLAAEAGDLGSLQAAAWLLATSNDPKVRDGAAAVRFATRAAQATEYQDSRILGTLAAAYAEAGEFQRAVETETKAIAASERDSERGELTARLKLYQAKQPYRAGMSLEGGF